MSKPMTRLSKFYIRKNCSLAWPLAANALLMQSMVIIDTLLVSPLGETPLAAMGIAGTIITFILGLQLALANGTQLIIGKVFGSKNKTALTQSFYQGLVINLIVGIVFLSLLTLFSAEIAIMLSNDAFLANETTNYLHIAQYIVLVNAITQSMTAYLNGQGNTKTTLHSYLVELPINIFVSYFLLFGFVISVPFSGTFSLSGLGLEGAAFGSLIAIIVRLIFLGIFIKRSGKYKVCSTVKFPSFYQLKEHFLEILPIAANFLVLAVGNTIYLLLFSQLNLYSYVAITLIFPWMKVATLSIVAWAQASAISVTQALGENNHSHINVILSTCFKGGGLLACVVSLILYVFSLCIEHIYPNIEHKTVLALSSIAPLYIALPLVRTFNTITGNYLRSIGKSVQVLKIHFFTQWFIALPLCALFILYYELSIFWAFALLPIEELIKAFPFYRLLKQCK